MFIKKYIVKPTTSFILRRICGCVDQGDVPGWVMITVMTAGLVVAIFSFFKGAIIQAVTAALNSVVGGVS